MTTSTKQTSATLAKLYDIPKSTVDLLRELPGYDPFLQAGDCYFDRNMARMWVSRFPLNIVHGKGPLAGKPFNLSRWQACQIANFYGWYNPDGTRRYKACLEYVAKKNGKTAKSAAWAMLELKGATEADYDEFGDTADLIYHEVGGEIYSAASSRDQAAKVFEHAALMCTLNPEFGEGMNVYGARGGGQVRSIVNTADHGSYRVLASDADTADGLNPSMGICDEIHRHKNGELCVVIENSSIAKPQPIILHTTTADYNRQSFCNDKLRYARLVADNDGDPDKPGYDPEFLPVLYEVRPDVYKRNPDCYEKKKYWYMSNPNLGTTFQEKDLQRLLRQAREIPTELNNFLRLHMNIVTETATGWLQMTHYDACSQSETPEQLEGQRCYAALDMSNKKDITALTFVFPDVDGGFDMFGRYWITEAAAAEDERNHGIPYRKWRDEGYIEFMPGETIDFRGVREVLLDYASRYEVVSVALDPWNCAETSKELEKEGIDVVLFRQGVISYNEPCKKLEQMIIEHTFRHDGNPVTRWAFQNVVIKPDQNENIKPMKDDNAPFQKIDPAVSCIMGYGVSIQDTIKQASVYNDRGFLSL